MKKIIAFAVLAAAFCGCQKMSEGTKSASEGAEAEYVTVNFDVNVDGVPATKSSSTSDTANEKAANDKQFAVFNGGTLEAYLPNGTTSAKLRTGEKYTVVAVVNGPSIASCSTVSAIQAVKADLDAYNSPSADFVMYGTKTMSEALGTSGATVQVPVSRLVGRVRLVSIDNSGIPSGVTCDITGAFLSNVYTEAGLGGTVTTSKYANWFGRKGTNSVGTDKIAASGDVSPTYDWASPLSGTIADAKFYTYPNSGTTFPAPGTAYAASSAALVVVATWNGTTCYYPVDIAAGVDANYTYDVTLTITGAGSDDPQVKPSQGSFNASVSVNPWTAGQDYSVAY